MQELKKILYVEDDLDIQLIAKISLESLGGFNVMCCSDGRSALSIAANFNPDLFLLDVMMPGMTGPETLNELRKIPNITDVPVIFITAKAQTQEIEKLLELGAIDVITKPFDPVALPEQIKTAWYLKKNPDSATDNRE